MLRDNKGSILVTTLMFFTIIVTVCMSCIAISYSNDNYSKLQYEHIRMKELALSGIEVTKSNILSQVKYAIEKFDDKENFKNYFLGNTREIIGDISQSGLKNVRVNIQGRVDEDSDGNINFVIESVSKSENYNKRVRANVKIINPWINYEEGSEITDIGKSELEGIQENNNEKDEINLELEENNEVNKEDNVRNENIDTTENHKSKFNEKELVVVYNYEEN